MLRTLLAAIIGALAGGGLGYGGAHYVGAVGVLVPTKGNMDVSVLVGYVLMTMGAASGGVVGGLAGATHAIVEAIRRSAYTGNAVHSPEQAVRSRI